MHPIRSLAVLAFLLSLCLTLRAQDEPRTLDISMGKLTVLHEQPEGAKPKLTMWVVYPHGLGSWLDHRQYLVDLNVRWRKQEVAVGVIMPSTEARAIAAEQPKLMVAAFADDDGDNRGRAISSCLAGLVRGIDGKELHWWQFGDDGAIDVVDHFLDEREPGNLDNAEQQVASLIANVADGGEFANQVKICLAALPHSGRARAAAVLNAWWCKGDLAAAEKAIDDGLRALANDAVPMTVFADYVLRGDRTNRSNARKIAMAMAPVAAGAPDGVYTQLVYLRAVLHAGQDRLAGRVAAKLQKKLKGDPRNQLIFAETLMDADTPAAFRDLAARAIDDAKASGELVRWSYGARHKVLVRCGDVDAAAKLMADYRKNNISNQGFNNDAWYMIVRPETMGRFDTLAGAQADEMVRVEGDSIDYGSKDTVALACFVNGRIDEAIELQTDAAQQSGNNSVYLGRLARYENTKKQLDAKKAKADGK